MATAGFKTVMISCFALIWSPTAESQSANDSVDAAVSFLREQQNEDGSYGTEKDRSLTTATVLLALGECHRHYEPGDGPFVRAALERLGSLIEESQFSNKTHAVARLSDTLRHFNVDDDSKAIRRLKETVQVTELGQFPVWHSLPNRYRFTTPLPGEFLNRAAREILETNDPDLWEGWSRLVAQQNDRTADSERAAFRQSAKAMIEAIINRQEKDGHFPGRSSQTVNTAQAILALTNLSRVVGKKSQAIGDVIPGPSGEIPIDGDIRTLARKRFTRALSFLESQQKDGRFQFLGASDPGITALALSSILRASKTVGQDPPEWVAQGLDYLATLAKPDGSLYEQGLKVYVTSVAVLAFVESGDPKYQPVIAGAQDFLRLVQADEGEGYDSESDWAYGGIGYGGDERPDLSNTQIALDALKQSGADTNDEAFKKVLFFLERCHNQREGGRAMTIERGGETIVPGDDGGATYFPGDSKAGYIELENGSKVARSYGSMTYALLKSYIFAGLDRDDPRILAVMKWIRKNYTLSQNPGFGPTMGPEAPYFGLYYYYFTLARALDAIGLATLEDESGVEHDWRRELALTLFSEQGDDGSWTNHRSSRWLEGEFVVATAYALNALTFCFDRLK